MFNSKAANTAGKYKKHSSVILISLVSIMIGSAILGAANIGKVGYWLDEIASIKAITDYAALTQAYPEQMPAYFIVLRGWINLVGENEIAGRWLSVLLGLVTLAVTYRLAHRYTSSRNALYALIVLASSAFFVRYYREMRPYAFLACFAVISMWFYLEWLRDGKYHKALFWFLATVIASYTHYFMGLLVAVQGLSFLYLRQSLRLSPRSALHLTRRDWLTLGVFALVAFVMVPYLQTYLTALTFIATKGNGQQALTPAQALNSVIQTLTNDSVGLFLLLITLAILMRQRGCGLLLLWLLVPLVTTLFVHSFIVQMLANPRYLIFVWPAMAVLVSMGITAVERLHRHAGVMAIGIVVLTGIGQVVVDLPRQQPGVLPDQPFREIGKLIEQHGREGDLLIVNMADLTGLTGYRWSMFYYLERYAPPSMRKPFELDFPPIPNHAQLLEHLDQKQGAWFIVTDGPESGRGKDALTALKTMQYAECHKWEYDHRSTFAEWQRVNGDTFTFGGSIEMTRNPINRIDQPVRSGTTIDVALGFYGNQQIPLDYSVGAYLLDANGMLVSQYDGPPAGSRTSTWIAEDRYCDIRRITVPKVAGTYTLHIAVYDSATGTRLDVNPTENDRKDVTVLALTVVPE
jgi:hypothetical protein